MVPLRVKTERDPRFPDFGVPRVVVDGIFEPAGPQVATGSTVFDSGLIDSGSGFVVIPHPLHRSGKLRIHRELGLQPYRVLSSTEAPVVQRFVEVGLCLVIKKRPGEYGYWPAEFVRVKAYLLDADQRPKVKVLVGLDALLENFVTHLEKDNLFVRARGILIP